MDKTVAIPVESVESLLRTYFDGDEDGVDLPQLLGLVRSISAAPAATAQDTSKQSTDRQDVSKSGAEIDMLAAQQDIFCCPHCGGTKGHWEGCKAPEVVTAQQDYTYASTQATNCAGCGERKHTPLRIDAMGGYVCLTCIDQKLGSLLGEFGYAQQDEWEVERLRAALMLSPDDEAAFPLDYNVAVVRLDRYWELRDAEERAALTAPQDAQERYALKSCSDEEVAAFEEWATKQKYDMTTHPLHWLFLNEKTYAARQGWRAALEFARGLTTAQLADKPEGKAEQQVGCEGKDGLLRIHSESETCDVCKAEQRAEPQLSDEEIARIFHEYYEDLAPRYGYETREESRKPWPEVPERNRSLMTAVVGRVRALLSRQSGDKKGGA